MSTLLVRRADLPVTMDAQRREIAGGGLHTHLAENHDDIGALAPGMAADFVAFGLDDLATAGALHDPVAALLLCHAPALRLNVVNGGMRVRDGQLTAVELAALVAHHNRLAARLFAAA